MRDPDLISQFVAITSCPAHVAEHILEAHGWNLEPSINFYMESGGVGHGNESARFDHAFDHSPPPTGNPLPASAAPRSSPLEILDEDDDDNLDDDHVMAENLARRMAARRAVEDYFDDDYMPDSNPHDSEVSLGGSSDLEKEEEDLVGEETEGHRNAGTRRRVRRNRPTQAAATDPALAQLIQRLGGPGAAEAGPSNRDAGHYHAAPEGLRDDDVIETIGDDVDDVPLPDDVDLEEQRMLLAAMTGEVYRGRIPDFATDPRYRRVQLSPGARAREQLRKEQDAAYHESLALDKIKAEAAERAEQEAREIAEAEAREAARVEREAAEAAAALERTLLSKQASLPEEPPVGSDDGVQIVVRMPSGNRLSRRFRQTDRLSVSTA